MKGLLYFIIPVGLIMYAVYENVKVNDFHVQISLVLLLLTLFIGLGSLLATIEDGYKKESDISIPIIGYVFVCIGLTLSFFSMIGYLVAVIGFGMYIFSNSKIPKDN